MPTIVVLLLVIALLGATQPASADVISDWNDKAVTFVRQPQHGDRPRPNGSSP